VPDLVIFDCDGVLIDSEALACRVDSECLAEIGIDLSAEAIAARYIGISTPDMLKDIARTAGRDLPPDLPALMRRRIREAFETRLVAIDGIADVLAGLAVPVCVASGSKPDRLEHSLGLVGLWQHFAPNVFSATQVSRGKPAPDLFLLAAREMSVPPSGCVVIEDSPFGVQAAVSAGMNPLGFTGASHCGPAHAEVLRKAGATRVFSRMAELPAILDDL
jgi:HAD superfamily hydrolase (TIGR01509 family)